MPHPSPSASFRLDINGLRAWAVMSVVLFHLGVPGLSGGFVGVDAFFVISGYLMTGILLKGLDAGRIPVADFLLARARRIVPALLLLCLSLLLLGYFVLLPLDYKRLASHSLATVAFFSNHKYWGEAGYFDASSHDKWLLHSWSLSVEWQFYLLLPLVFLAVFRLGGRRRQLWLVLGGLGLLSLGLSVWLSLRDPTAAYYGLHSRAWEMLLGGLLHALPAWRAGQERLRSALEALGALFLLGSMVLIDGRWPWPGLPALLPTVGTAAILLAARQNSPLTAPTLLQYLGSRSYSIYLWHWPACVVLSYLGQERQALPQLAALLATLLLSEASWRLAEQAATRHLARWGRGPAALRLAGATALPAVLAVGLWLAQGWPGRFDARAEAIAAVGQEHAERASECHAREEPRSPMCQFGEGPPAWVLLGDSHASILVGAVKAALPPGRSLLQMTYSGCPYVHDARFDTPWASASYDCAAFNRWARDTIATLPPEVGVVLASRYASRAFGANEAAPEEQRPRIEFPAKGPVDPDRLGHFASQLSHDICELAATRPVWVVRPIPEIGRHVPQLMSRRLAMGQEPELGLAWQDYQARNAWVWQAQDEARRRCGARIIDPTALLCDGQRCATSRQGRPLYIDDNHLSGFGNAELAPVFRKALREQDPSTSD
ncbi:acyltransferase family protein [Roseateles sp. DB2]|uniref:acyltransferase family protein n=1 Tax=Roseateles sp. DB2 TaxID=3453717 RepID=UPI003EEE6BFE